MFAAVRCFFLLLCCTPSLWSQGPSQLTFSSNLVYTGEPLTLTVTYGSGLQLVNVLLEAFNGTLQRGFLYCKVSPINTTGMGVFTGKSFDRCPSVPGGSENVSVTFTATPPLELNYTCTVRVNDGNNFYYTTCNSAFIPFNVCPLPPTFQQTPIVFNDSDRGIIVCESRNGKPAANVSLTVIGISGTRQSNGIDLATVVLLAPLPDWHNATVTCRVTNHNCSNMNITICPDMYVTSPVMINHIINTSVPDVICTNESTVMLNCATYVSGYPGVLYTWTVPTDTNVTSSLHVASLAVPQGQSGLYNCTATNNLTAASLVIVFTVSNACRPGMMTTSNLDPPCVNCWIIGLVLGIIVVVIIAVVLGVICKRGLFLNGSISASPCRKHNLDVCVADRSSAATPRSDDREYDSLDKHSSIDPTYAKLALENSSNRATLYENFK